MSADDTEVEVFVRGFRSRLWLLALLVVVGLGAALWTGTRERGIGAPDDRRRLMVVTQAGDIDYYAVLERGGFAVEVDSYADWEASARAELPESEAEGVALVLELADERGFGFVVFEAPSTLDFDGLELEPSLDAIDELDARDYAVLSVGDLAFPHHLSVDDPGDDPLLRIPGYGAIQAVLRQPAVSAREDDERPTVEELQYEDAIEVARWMYERPTTFAAAIEFAQASIDATLSEDPHARTLLGPLAAGSALPTPDGGVLVVHHALDVYSDDARSLTLGVGESMHFGYLSPDAVAGLFETGELELASCASLAGGSIEMDREPRIEAAIDGSALAIATLAGEARIWRKVEGPGCVWREHASLPASGSVGVLAPRLRARAGGQGQQTLAARVVDIEPQGATVAVWLDAESGVDEGRIDERGVGTSDGGSALELLRLPEAEVGALVFIDDVQLALLSRTPLPPEQQTTTARAEHAIHVLDRRRPGAHLRIPTDFFAQGRALHELALVSPAVIATEDPQVGELHGPRFAVRAAGVSGSELILVELGAQAWQTFEDAMVADGEGGLHTLTPDDLEARVVDTAGRSVEALTVSTRAGALAYAAVDGALPSELAVNALDGGPARYLSNNEVIDTLPRFTADGRYLVYVTMVRSSLSPVPYSVPRIAPVPAAE
ncbi:hypothetical protein ENSA5_25890 [Enhygromyxa salina]|uniref:Uncharacterized protein n=1 Tax=Enhygromyxa salina TaxID=215803 RepID=A0A2S9YAI9_9BACT|nr:hypothetical protein [Enhygromyxa salina]PRQ02130.1 hypothetical protein ENSA5_25890 [Enhygromyxa salina]